jgi:hypothetical protein
MGTSKNKSAIISILNNMNAIFKLPMLCGLSQALASTDFDNIGEELEHSCEVQDPSVEDSS